MYSKCIQGVVNMKLLTYKFNSILSPTNMHYFYTEQENLSEAKIKNFRLNLCFRYNRFIFVKYMLRALLTMALPGIVVKPHLID